MGLLLYVAIALPIYFTLQTIYVALLKPGVSEIPGPFLAKFSGLPSLFGAYRRAHGKWLQALHKQYGPYVRIGPERFSISDPAVIPSIYDFKNEFMKSEKMAVMHGVVNGKIVPGMVSTTNKAQHAAIRRPVAHLYSMSNLMTYEGWVDDTIRTLVRRVAEEFADTGRACDLSAWAQYWASDTITTLTTSKAMGFLEKGGDVDGMLEQLRGIQRYRSLVIHAPWIDWLLVKNPVRRYFSSTPVRIMQRARGIVMGRMKSQAAAGAENKRDMLSQLLEVHKQKPEQVPQRRIMAYVGVNLQAGTDTTAAHFRSVFYHVLKTPGLCVAKKLQSELDASGFKHPIAYHEALQLPYLDAVIKEAQRVFFVGAGVMERVVPASGLKLPNGVTLPQGAGVGVGGITVQFDKAVFGDDADEYNPERWLRGEKESESHYAERLGAMKIADMTWGKGSRTCLGRNVAMLELYKAVATLFGVFDMELVDPKREWRVEENFFRAQFDMDVNFAWRSGKSLKSLRLDGEDVPNKDAVEKILSAAS